MQRPTIELSLALRQMLSKNSDRLTAEEVIILEEVMICLSNLQTLEKQKDHIGKNVVRRKMKLELIQLSSYLAKFLMHPSVIETIGNLFK